MLYCVTDKAKRAFEFNKIILARLLFCPAPVSSAVWGAKRQRRLQSWSLCLKEQSTLNRFINGLVHHDSEESPPHQGRHNRESQPELQASVYEDKIITLPHFCWTFLFLSCGTESHVEVAWGQTGVGTIASNPCINATTVDEKNIKVLSCDFCNTWSWNSWAGVSCWRINLRASCIPLSYVLITYCVTTKKGTFTACSVSVLSTVPHSLGPASPH